MTEENWQLNAPKLADRGHFLLETGIWSDRQFSVGEPSNLEVFPVHKIILSTASPVFEAMFYGKLAEQGEFIYIDDVSPRGFKQMLRYVYTDNVDIEDFQEVFELYYLAKKYMLPPLTQLCKDFMLNGLSAENACKTLAFAKLHEEDDVEREAMNKIRNDTETVLKGSSITELSEEMVSEILDQDELKVDTELDLFRAVHRWSIAECSRKELQENDSNLQTLARNLIRKIRFLTMTADEFSTEPAWSPLLSENERLLILMNISSKIKQTLPDGFCTSTKPRSHRINDAFPCIDPGRYFYIPAIKRDKYILTEVPAGTNVSLAFTVNRDVYIHGIDLQSQIYLEQQEAATSSGRTFEAEYYGEAWVARSQNKRELTSYSENIRILLRRFSDGQVLASRKLNETVNLHELHVVYFSNPTEIKCGHTYTIEVLYKNAGYYRMYFSKPMLVTDDLTVFFHKLESNLSPCFVGACSILALILEKKVPENC